jgi:iron complex outermembrane recepter protein
MSRSLLVLAVLIGPPLALAEEPAPANAEKTSELTELTLEQLVNTKVTSVQKRPESVRQTAAAITVITGEEIVASGATSLPALLRRVPGVHVAQLDASQWALGIRGFTNSVARSQLAIMDGRSLYTPLFAGTYWDVQNAFLEDVDRVEVVRGPGGTLWGANAVTGIVNIITKSASDTQGGLIVLGGGNKERGFGRARFGGTLGGNGAYRVYGMYFNRAAEYHADSDDYDDWHMFQGGFRTDWSNQPSGTLTLQGDLYSGRAGRRTTFATFTFPYTETLAQDADLSGGNLRARWSRALDRPTTTGRIVASRTSARIATPSTSTPSIGCGLRGGMTSWSAWATGSRTAARPLCRPSPSSRRTRRTTSSARSPRTRCRSSRDACA